MMATTNSTAGVSYAAAAMAFSFGGVTTEHFMMGCICYMVGAGGRFGLKMSSAFEAERSPKWGALVGALSIAPFLAAFASMATYLAAHIAGFEGDAGIGIFLAIVAFKGSEGINYVVSLASKAIPDKLGGAPPSNQETKP